MRFFCVDLSGEPSEKKHPLVPASFVHVLHLRRLSILILPRFLIPLLPLLRSNKSLPFGPSLGFQGVKVAAVGACLSIWVNAEFMLIEDVGTGQSDWQCAVL